MLRALPLLLIGCTLGEAPSATVRPLHQSLRNAEGAWSDEAQGVAHDSEAWFLTQAWALWRIPLDHDLRRPLAEADPKQGIFRAAIPLELRRQGYRHLGDPEVHEGVLYVPLEGRWGRARIVAFDPHTLRYLGSATLKQRRAPWLAFDARGRLHTSTFHISRRRPIRRYALRWRGGELRLRRLRPLALDRKVRRVQGGAFDPQGNLHLVSDHRAGGLLTFDPAGHLLGRHEVPVRRGFPYYEELEGLTFWPLPEAKVPGIHGDLHLLLLDNDLNEDEVFFKHFALQAKPTTPH